jgi:hypothetical protein
MASQEADCFKGDMMEYIPLRNAPCCESCGKNILHGNDKALFDGKGYTVEDLEYIKNHHEC